MAVYIEIESQRLSAVYKIDKIKSYRVEQSLDIPADGFEFIIGNTDYDVSDVVSPGDKLSFYVNKSLVVRGYIDDVELEYNVGSNDIRITGRDKIAMLLDSDALPKTYNSTGLSTYLSKVMPKYGIKYSSDNNSKFDKIVISPGETEYDVIDRLSKERNLITMFDSYEDKMKCTKLASTTAYSYLFSNTDKDGIRVMNSVVTISNDIKNEVIVYGGDYEKNKNIKGTYKDSSLKTNKIKIMNESNIEKSADAAKRAKEEFYNFNKNAFFVSITTTTKLPIYLNRCARVKINKMGLDCYLLVDKVIYSKSIEGGSITNITLKLMPGIKVKFKNNDIPLLPKL